MNDFFDDVGDFHDKFGIPAFNPGRLCVFPSNSILEYRLKFLKEEIRELEEAIEQRNLAGALDAIGDTVYVALGTAHYFNAPFRPIWREIHHSNMKRIKVTPENCPPDKQYRADMVIKPVGWIPPRIQMILDDQEDFVKSFFPENLK